MLRLIPGPAREGHSASPSTDLALTDALTELPNRRSVDQWLAAVSVGPDRPPALVDADHVCRRVALAPLDALAPGLTVTVSIGTTLVTAATPSEGSEPHRH